jgi:hypothetical protein
MRKLVLFCALGLLMVQGCVVVPIPTAKKTLAGTEIEPARQKLIQVGVTTASEVVKELGPPAAHFDDIRVYAYAWEARIGYVFWFIYGGLGYPQDGATGDRGVGTLTQGYVMLIEFDEQDRVRRFERTKQGNRETVRSRAVAWAKAGKNAAALGLPSKFVPLAVPPGQSAIYVYRPGGWSEPILAGGAAVEVSMTEQKRADLRRKEYIVWIVEPGSHEITMSPQYLPGNKTTYSPGTLAGYTIVAAQPDQAAYVEIRVATKGGNYGPLATIVPEAEAMQTLSKLKPW